MYTKGKVGPELNPGGFHKILYLNQFVYHSPGIFASDPLNRKQED